MFDKLRGAFASAAKTLSERELSAKDVDAALLELEMSLLESDVAFEVVEAIKSKIRGELVGTSVEKGAASEVIQSCLAGAVSDMLDSVKPKDLLELVLAGRESGKPFIMLFVGINGVGKTTTLAKVAHMLRQSKVSVVVAAADTFRAGAIEQLREHANRLGIKIVAQNYGSDPAAVARDAVLHATAHKIDCVLVDTAGRMQTSQNLMAQIEKITGVVKPDFKVFVGDSLAGNDTVSQAREFYEHTRFDGSILTKSDADARGGAALSIISETKTPVMYVGTGQEYGDLEPFSKEAFLEAVFGSPSLPAASVPEREAGGERPAADTQPKAAQEARQPEPALHAGSAAQSDPAPQEEQQPAPGHDAGGAPQNGPETQGGDPFAGIAEGDIKEYADIHDEAPPESDEEARKTALKVRKWINDGRPGAHDAPKKKSLFGRIRK